MNEHMIEKLGFRITRYHGPVEGRSGDVDGWLFENLDDPNKSTSRHMASASEVMLWHLIERLESKP